MAVDPDPEARQATPLPEGPPEPWREAIRARDEELRALREEVRHLRGQLRAIHTSSGWAVLRTLSQMREVLAPRGGRRDRIAQVGIAGLRRLKRGLNRLVKAARHRRAPIGVVSRPLNPDTYAVVCLPIIEWSFRFQRPQQLMRRFAARGHQVYYAANHFQRGQIPRLQPVEPNLEEIVLPGDPAANVYHRMPTESEVERMALAVARLRDDRDIRDAVIVVQLPFWTALAERLRDRFGWSIIYDCMDDHSGFYNNTEEILQGEARLVAEADLVVASSEGLRRKVAGRARDTLLLRNACEYVRFRDASMGRRPRGRRPIIGYYGAIAEWFDSDLVVEMARLRPGWRFELIGSTLSGDSGGLELQPNVKLLGERPYDDLPRLVRDWDVFLIPFKRVPLTEATNPVKVYEMLATGKPVVAVGLPELVPLAESGLIRIASDSAAFAATVEAALAEDDPASALARQAFAKENTWQSRFETLAEAIDRVRRVGGVEGRVDPTCPSPKPHMLMLTRRNASHVHD